MDRLKIVWICNVLNPEIRSHLCIRTGTLESFLMRVIGHDESSEPDIGIWNTNGINEMKRIARVELHVVSPVRNLATARQDFEIDGVTYHFVREENSGLYRKVVRYFFNRFSSQFRTNRKRICAVIFELEPDLVHVIGAENPHYSLAMLDLPQSIPTLLQLQALLASVVEKTVGIQRRNYLYIAEIEKRLIRRADYVGTRVPSFIDYIRSEIDRDVRIVDTTLAMAQSIDMSETSKEFDFVHYALTLGQSKATDIAVEAFALAYKKHPEITLDIIGGTTPEFKRWLTARIDELGIGAAVTLEGRLATHDDVITQIRKARYALLPLRIDIIPNTLHEAMANGLPVVTTVTPRTPELNENRECVLISPQNDINDISKNMVRLLEEDGLADTLRTNAVLTEGESTSNASIIGHWIEVYEGIIQSCSDGVPLPDKYLL